MRRKCQCRDQFAQGSEVVVGVRPAVTCAYAASMFLAVVGSVSSQAVATSQSGSLGAHIIGQGALAVVRGALAAGLSVLPGR